ncbi:hypothetical protein AVEN_178382-1 [Araneus ventricosus]|uniref:Transposase Tc1-like domain-containing protein n=1 Tax=Araneus ventricosus TaxID=182803 RepID=A0A4Y2BCD6_ARAVE|nr:hypothetical protein AVEN_178382-1 [Araneus ventricosus]
MSKRGIYQILACGKNLKRKSGSGRPRVTSSRDDMHIRILVSTRHFSPRIKSIIGGQISKKTVHRRILESEYMKNRNMPRSPGLTPHHEEA